MKHPSHSKKVLITGIDSFTGKYLEKELSLLGYIVYGTVLNQDEEQNHLPCDIRNLGDIQNVITKTTPDYVFHLAAISFVGETDHSLIYDVNVLGTQNLLEALILNNINPSKVILASSATVYGVQHSNILDESMCPNPVNHYGISKLAMEKIVHTYYDRLNIIVTRPFNYTGPGQDDHFLIPKIIKHYREHQPSIELGNLDVSREFNDIRFVVDTYIKLMLSQASSETVNICTGRDIALLEIIELMNRISGYHIEIKVNSDLIRDNEIKRLAGSSKKLFSIIGSDIAHTIEDTLKSMYCLELID